MKWSDSCEVILFRSEVKWREVSYGEVLGGQTTMYIRVTLYWGYLIVLWLFNLVCILYCGCFNWFCIVWVCVCVFYNVWVFWQFCGCFGNMCTCCIFDRASLYRLLQTTTLMHNFILQQCVCYIKILNMFRAARCSSSGGQIVLLQPLVSSPSVNSRTVRRWRADCSLNLHTVRLFTEGDDTRGCSNTICPPEDEQRAARNMLRILM